MSPSPPPSRVSTRIRTVPNKYKFAFLNQHSSKQAKCAQVMKPTKSPKTVQSLGNMTPPLMKELRALGISTKSLNITKTKRDNPPGQLNTSTETKTETETPPRRLNAKQTKIDKPAEDLNITKSKIDSPVQLAKTNETLNQKTPQAIMHKNDPVIVDSSSILIIKQPILKNDPLVIPPVARKELISEIEAGADEASTETTDMETETEEIEAPANEASAETTDMETETEEINEPEVIKRKKLINEKEAAADEASADEAAAEEDAAETTDMETETEEINEPEVIKRIFLVSKAVQTKFTCNGSICGLVDSDEFNLNCFYCYKIFPLHEWLEFKEHIKIQHHVEEKPAETQEPNEPENFEPSPRKALLKTPEVKSTNNLNPKTPLLNKPITGNNQLNLPVKFVNLNKAPLTNTQLNQSNGNLTPQTLDSTKQIIQPIEVIDICPFPKKSPPKKLPAQKQAIQQINQTKDVKEKSPPKKLRTNAQLPDPQVYIDLSSDTENRRSTEDELNTSYVDEIISLGDDDNEEEEEIDLSDVLQSSDAKKVPKSSSTKVTTLKNSKSQLNDGKVVVLQGPKNSTISKVISFPKPINTTQTEIVKIPSNITVKRVNISLSNKTDKNVSVTTTLYQSEPILKKAYIKLPANLNIQEVIKTIPKPTSPQDTTTTGATKPRYFVVKKVAKPSEIDKESIINLPKDTIITKIGKQNTNDDEDDMPSNDENEDDVPKPTNGCGILFGLTNRQVVLEFLLKLKGYPELWRPHLNVAINYDESLQQLCSHLNQRFDLNIQNFEMRLSIQRVKDWYCRTLKKIFVHNQDRSKVEPFKHTFPEYFDILNNFLTSNVHFTKNLLLSEGSKETTASLSNYPKWMVFKPGQAVQKYGRNYFEEHVKLKPKPKPIAKAATPLKKKPIIKFKPSKLPQEDTSQNVIEFDADTLYAIESSDDESLILPPEPKPDPMPRKKYTLKLATRIYNPKVPIVCDVCNRNFKRPSDLKRHHVLHFPPQFKCETCSQMFYHRHFAERCNHVKRKKIKNVKKVGNDDNANDDEFFWPTNDNAPTITNVKSNVPMLSSTFRKWMCEECGMSYRSVGSLSTHKRAKHWNFRFKCGVCKFSAQTKYRVSLHQKKRHVVTPGTVEEIAKKCRARLDSKTPFTPEARQEFDWRREMRKNLKPGEKFYGCCKCRIIFNTRKEKVLHNKIEHPIKDTTVICLLCLPEKMLLSNSNSVRRHYTDQHKIPWDEIDDLVKRTKPIFKFLTKEEIELLNTSENYTELLWEIIARRNIKFDGEPLKEETLKATEILQNEINQEQQKSTKQKVVNDGNQEINEILEKTIQEENVYVEGIINHDYNNHSEHENQECYQENIIEDNHTIVEYQNRNEDEEEIQIDGNNYTIQHEGELVDDELIEESVVVDEIAEAEYMDDETIGEAY